MHIKMCACTCIHTYTHTHTEAETKTKMKKYIQCNAGQTKGLIQKALIN